MPKLSCIVRGKHLHLKYWQCGRLRQFSPEPHELLISGTVVGRLLDVDADVGYIAVHFDPLDGGQI